MSNEISVSCSLSIAKSGVLAQLAKSIQADLAGNSLMSHIQSLSGTTREAMTVGPDITLGGFCMIVNLSTSANVTVHYDDASPDATNTIATLLPGEPCLIKPASGATVYFTPSA